MGGKHRQSGKVFVGNFNDVGSQKRYAKLNINYFGGKMDLVYSRKASIGERAVALLIDQFIITLLFIALIVISAIFNFEILVLLALTFPVGYIFKDIILGRSIGKRIMKLGVKDIYDPSIVPSTGNLILRNLFLVLGIIEFLVMLFSENQSRIGDIVSKTTVVKLERENELSNEKINKYKEEIKDIAPRVKKKIGRIVLIIIACFLAFILLIITITATVMKTNQAYKLSVYTIENSKEINTFIGDIQGYGLIPTGSISVSNGWGEARFTIKVKGEYDTVKVYTYLTKEPDTGWIIHEFIIRE